MNLHRNMNWPSNVRRTLFQSIFPVSLQIVTCRFHSSQIWATFLASAEHSQLALATVIHRVGHLLEFHHCQILETRKSPNILQRYGLNEIRRFSQTGAQSVDGVTIGICEKTIAQSLPVEGGELNSSSPTVSPD